MYETGFIAAILVLLAITGSEPGHAQTAKFCKTGYVAALLTHC